MLRDWMSVKEGGRKRDRESTALMIRSLEQGEDVGKNHTKLEFLVCLFLLSLCV